LDGLRGIAAIAVMVYHMVGWFAGGYLFGHGYMAVDFFFVLSGFVVAHAYSGRLGQAGGFRAFVLARVVRLYPTLLLGTAVGIAIYLFRSHALGMPLDRLVLADCLASLVPFPAFWRQGLFPIDPAVWSLFWEIVVNIAFALFMHRMRSAWLVALAVVLGGLLIGESLASHGVEFGPYRDGWEFGGVRAFYGFVLGMLLLRWLRKHPAKHKRRQIWVVIAVVLMLTGIPVHGAWSVGYDVLIMILINPLVVLVAARSAPIAPRLDAWGGAMSYPLYVVHTPILMLLGGVLSRLHAADRAPAWLIGVVIAAMLIMLADALNRWFDVPLRRYLKRRLA
jgi:peptidoglycan/LPS O-acetylase OafA/YrhL